SPLTCGNNSNAVPLYFAVLDKGASDCCYSTSWMTSTPWLASKATSSRALLPVSSVPKNNLPSHNPTVVDNFYTISTTERDLALESGYVAGRIDSFIYPTQICGSIPFYQIFAPAATEHFYIISAALQHIVLAQGGWTDQLKVLQDML
ncbi:hypothetical protein C8R43DRAFT_887866, partial [Mycena crocata]